MLPSTRTNEVYAQIKPWRSNEERLVDEALAANTLPASQIAHVRPPIPRVILFPPKYGYNRDALGIRDIINVEVLYPGARVDYSQSNSGYSGTSYPSLSNW